MKYIGLFFILIIISSTSLSAQETENSELFENITDIEKLIQLNITQGDKVDSSKKNTVNQSNDSLLLLPYRPKNKVALDSTYSRRENGTLKLPDYEPGYIPDWMTLRDTIIVDPLFLPVLFTGDVLPHDLDLYPKVKEYKYKGKLISQDKTFTKRIAHSDFVSARRMDFYRQFPDKVKYSYMDFDEALMVGSDRDVVDAFNPFKELISTETSFSLEAPTVDKVKIRRRFWTRSGDHALQFSQTYFSPNWHRGGTDNFNIINSHTLRFNYRKNKVRFNNTIEMRLALITAPDDTLRSYRISDDVLRYNADFGIDAFGKHWSYSTNIDARTQFFNNHPSNSSVVQSAFLAPLYVSGGIGLRYNLDKASQKVRHRRIRLSFSFDPASMSYRYVGNEKVDVKRYGIEEGKKSKIDIGSTITGNLIYDFNRYIDLNSKFRYFTSYHKVEAELENTLNMSLTNAFSTRLFLHLRFDDKVPPDPKFKYLQITELLSFGLKYRW